MKENFFEWLEEAAKKFKRATDQEPDLLFIPLFDYPEFLKQADDIYFDKRYSEVERNVGSSKSLEYFEWEGLKLLVLGFESHRTIKEPYLASSQLADEYFKNQEKYG